MRLGVAVGNRTRDFLHCRRTLYAKSHSNGVIDCHSEPLLVLLQRQLYMIAASGFLSINTVTGKGSIGHLSIGMRSTDRRAALLSGEKQGKGTDCR